MPTVLSLFSHRHRRSPATSPALLLVATSLSTSTVHPPSPFSLSSRSHCRPTATTLPPPLSLSSLRPLHIRPLSLHLGVVDYRRLLSLSSTVGFFLRRGRYRCRLLSLFFAALPSPPRCSFVGYLGVRKNLHGFEARRPRPPTSVPSLFSPSALAPSSLIDAAAVASFTAAFLIPPPLMSSPPPYSPSLPCLPTSDPRGSSSASTAAPSRLRLRSLPQPWTRAGDGHRLGEDVGVSLIPFSFWAGNGLKLYLVGWVGLAYWAQYGLGWPVG